MKTTDDIYEELFEPKNYNFYVDLLYEYISNKRWYNLILNNFELLEIKNDHATNDFYVKVNIYSQPDKNIRESTETLLIKRNKFENFILCKRKEKIKKLKGIINEKN